ncbi:ABC transporter permease [Spirosoma montaniterrae]|uniref:Macrolide ABC transporter permease n=1 Tax=Spirosoma montaniterrae TaxID=1178516 RepID=A0A1P9X0D9_9BACT|nr:ABC transporter permease [Spirosoma montaniterrae]AQG81068.1 macrolide ABC transporter permease [Spirosoma montaniterrae]
MLRNYLKIALRSLWNNRLLTAINVLGLSVGLACVVVLVLFAQKCLTWDTAHEKLDRIYYVQTTSTDGTAYNETVYPLLGQMLRSYTEIETGTHIQNFNNPWIEYKGKNVQEETAYVDSTFFDVFTFPLKYGNPATALVSKRSVVLTEKVAQHLFGNENPVGKTVTVNDTLQYQITGVLEEIPANSSQQFQVLMPAANLFDQPGFRENADWYNTFSNTFILLREGANPAQLQAKLPQLVKAHYNADAKSTVLRLAAYQNFVYTENPRFAGLIYGSVIIAVFLLLIISINLINLNTASSLPRAKEVAMRQVVGATRWLVLRQFWVESGLVVVVSLGLSVLFALYYLIPTFNQLGDRGLQLIVDWNTDYPTILTVLGVTLVVALVAGTYPALFLLGLKTTDAVKGKLSFSPKRGLIRQRLLIVIQFTLAVVFILGTIVMRGQIVYMKDAKLGYEKENVLIFSTDRAYRNVDQALVQGQTILNRLRANPNVVSFTSSEQTPVEFMNNFNTYYPEGNEARKVHLRHGPGAVGFTETFRIPMLEGRNFSDQTPADSVNHAVIINESAMKAFGWTTAVGKKLRQLNDPLTYTIVGVTKDYHYRDLKDKVGPMLQSYYGRQSLNTYLSVRLADKAKAPALIAQIEREFAKIPARRPLTYAYLTDEVAKAYRPLDNIWQMIRFVTLVAILTACAGIFGLITLVTRQRTKEIGIRKVLGASVVSIATLLSSDFLKLVLLAIGIASPLGWWLGEIMLNYFAYRAQTQWWHFALAGTLAVGIALLTVSYQSIKAALMNPVKSLRSE